MAQPGAKSRKDETESLAEEKSAQDAFDRESGAVELVEEELGGQEVSDNTELAKQPTEVQQLTPTQKWMRELSVLAQIPDSRRDAADVSAGITSAMLMAETLEEALEAQDSGLPSSKTLVGKELSITDFVVCESGGQFDNGLGHYFLIEATLLETGEQILFSSGAPNIMTIVWKVRQANRFPYECKIEGSPTKNGELLRLKPLPKRAVRVIT